METVNIIVLRRNPEDLPLVEIDTIRTCFKGVEIKFVRTDPKNSAEHRADCKRLNPATVIVPPDYQIIREQVECGLPHITLTPTNVFGCLKPASPEFEKFKPCEAVSFDADHGPENPINTQAAKHFGLIWDKRRRVYVDSEGCPVRDRFGQPL